MVAGCCMSQGRFAAMCTPLREETSTAVWKALSQHALLDPAVFIQETAPLVTKLKAFWNALCNKVSIHGASLAHPDLYTLLVKMGSTNAKAAEYAAKFWKVGQVEEHK